MTRTCRRICALLARLGYVWPDGSPPADVRIRRTRAGWHQRSAGAWSWCLESPTRGLPDVGSQYPAGDIARSRPEHASLYTAPWGSVAIILERNNRP